MYTTFGDRLVACRYCLTSVSIQIRRTAEHKPLGFTAREAGKLYLPTPLNLVTLKINKNDGIRLEPLLSVRGGKSDTCSVSRTKPKTADPHGHNETNRSSANKKRSTNKTLVHNHPGG